MKVENESERIRELEAEIDKLEDENARIIGSISWRITLPLRLLNGALWFARQKVRIFIHSLKKNPRLRLNRYSELKQAEQMYLNIDEQLTSLKPENITKTAVIIHLYYTEAWPVLNEKLQKLQAVLPFDLYVSLAASNSEFAQTITESYPNARVLLVPNRGRDVLPFMKIASKLDALGYECLLKLHSKKSPHRKDGQEWFTDILNCLVPDSHEALMKIKEVLASTNCGIIGPGNQYISLKVNYDSNSFFLLRSLKRIYSKSLSRQVNRNREDYGFFAGTMFWARFDALHNIFQVGFDVSDFEHEARHIDGTLAHGLERVFCVGPELEGRDIYGVNGALEKIPHKTYNIPEWSDIHPINKKLRRNKID